MRKGASDKVEEPGMAPVLIRFERNGSRDKSLMGFEGAKPLVAPRVEPRRLPRTGPV